MSWAFSDESERADRMLFGTLFVEAQHTYELRKQLRSLLLPGQRRVHMAKEGARRRRVILDAIVDLETQVTVLELRRLNGVTRPEARAMLLSVAAGVVAERSSRFWVLDNIEESQMRRDELQLHGAGAEAVFDHRHRTRSRCSGSSMSRCGPTAQEANGSGARLRSSTSAESRPKSAKPSYSPSGELAGFTFRSSWNGQYKYAGNQSARKSISRRERRTRLANQRAGSRVHFLRC